MPETAATTKTRSRSTPLACRPPGEYGLVPGPHPTAEENRALGRLVRAGIAAGAALEADGAPGEGPERSALLAAVKDGLEARGALIEGNLALAVRMGSEQAYRTGCEAEDAIGDALVGLTTAPDRFDTDRYGTDFSTYASWRIKGALAAGRRRDVGDPRSPASPVVWGLGISGGGPASGGDAPLPCDPPDHRPGPGEDDGGTDAAERVALLIGASGLSAREREVIARRYGLEGRAAETLERIGKRLRVTKERVRQIEVAAIRKLRKAAALAGAGNLPT